MNARELNTQDLAHLDQLIEAVSRDPNYIRDRQAAARVTMSGADQDAPMPFVVAEVLCCALLMAHIETGAPAGAQDRERRLRFARNASLEDLLDVREKARGKIAERELAAELVAG
jgi:hypothetical protein